MRIECTVADAGACVYGTHCRVCARVYARRPLPFGLPLCSLTCSATALYVARTCAVFCGVLCMRTALERRQWMVATVRAGEEVLERSIGTLSAGSGLLQPASGVKACRVRW